MKLFGLGLIGLVLGSCYADSTCFEELGCFSNDYPYNSQNRVVPPPWSPDQIGTEFWLYTSSNKNSPQHLDYDDLNTIKNSNFKASRLTKFLIHGFISNGDTDWVEDLRKILLNTGDLNVIVVHWENGANPYMHYGQACSNTRVVGAEIALMITKLQSVGAANSQMHVIGHSLGAHVAGYAGESTPGMGRITGLDPAGPFFEDTDPLVRLDPSDANYVDAIHTDAETIWQLGAGIAMPVGHADFYPNGGINQPGCPGNEYDPGEWWRITCNHGRACQLMSDSIVNEEPPMVGYPCDNYEDYQAGRCKSCSRPSCANLGYYSDEGRNTSNEETYYLTTNSVAPFANEKNP